MLREKRGITLIALVVTIIVLLILAAVSISAITGENGIMTKAKKAQEKTESAKLEEELNLKLVDMQIEMATEDITNSISPFEALGMKGLYRYQVFMGDNVYAEMDGIFETNSGLARATLVVTEDENGNENLKYTNVKSVSSIPDMAIPLYKLFMLNDMTDLEIVDETEGVPSILGVKYKNIVYDIVELRSSSNWLISISVREDIAEVSWKNVFSDRYGSMYALDTNNKLWAMMDETEGICLNNIYPEFNNFIIEKPVYHYNYYGEKMLTGFVGTDGKIYMLNLGNSNSTKMVNCINDEFSDKLGNVKAKDVFVEYESLGVINIDTEIEYEYPCLVILDTNGKIWTLDHEYDYDNEKVISDVKCINNEASELANVSFKEIVANRFSSSEPYFFVARRAYFTLIGLDTNNKLWKVQYRDYDYETDTDISEFEFFVDNLYETNSVPLLRDICPTGNYGEAMLITQDNKLYRYEYGYRTDESSLITDTIPVEKFKDGLILDINGNLYDSSLDKLNDTYYGGNKIKELYEYRYVLTEDGTLYWPDGNYMETIDSEIKAFSTNSWNGAYIDGNNDIHMYMMVS